VEGHEPREDETTEAVEEDEHEGKDEAADGRRGEFETLSGQPITYPTPLR
jgi:hypothetical protein